MKEVKRSALTEEEVKQIADQKFSSDQVSRVRDIFLFSCYTAIAIVNKYKHDSECVCTNKVFPVLSNQKMNAYLKEIADLCGISKKLTYHLARHTFTTTITLSNGVPIETVSKMPGHKNLKTT